MSTTTFSWETTELFGFADGTRLAYIRWERDIGWGARGHKAERHCVAVREFDTFGPRADFEVTFMTAAEYDRAESDDFARRHQECLAGCSHGDVCVSEPDGVNDCRCGGSEGQPVGDGNSTPLGYVHDKCRAFVTTLYVRDTILASLMLREGVEINALTAGERANNLAMELVELFDIKLKTKGL
jgi:hypothetical protein